MKAVNLSFDLFRDLRFAHEDTAILQLCLDLLTLRNEQLLLRHPETPLIYPYETYYRLGFEPPDLPTSGCYYQEEPPGEENFDSIPKVLRNGSFDCDDGSAWRAAELRVRFGDPGARAILVGHQTSPNYIQFHAMVMRGDGTIEDPSVVGGMADTPDSIRDDLRAIREQILLEQYEEEMASSWGPPAQYIPEEFQQSVFDLWGAPPVYPSMPSGWDYWEAS